MVNGNMYSTTVLFSGQMPEVAFSVSNPLKHGVISWPKNFSLKYFLQRKFYENLHV